MKLLMHTCCAPCSIHCIDSLRQEGIEPTLYWYNPNIHPMKEYKTRKNTLVDYSKSISAKLIIENEYGLRNFINEIYPDYDNRCGVCYKMRMFKTAEYASQNGFTHFTSTLFVSPYQNHELLKATALLAAEKFNVTFLYKDFRTGFNEGQQKARDLGLYMQKYCGCVFSEEDRYTKKKKK